MFSIFNHVMKSNSDFDFNIVTLTVSLGHQSTPFLCTTNYCIDHIIKRFHEKNSIMPGLFS